MARNFNEKLRIRRWKPFQYLLKLLGLALPNPIKIDDHILFHHKNDFITIVTLSKDHDIEVSKAITSFLKPGMTMIDAGANIGYFTLIAARAVGPHGHVYAFEPVPATVELLKKNVEVNGYNDRVTIVPKALTNKNTKVRIFLDSLHSGVSSMFRNGHEKDFVDVEGISLDEFFAKQDWPPIHLIKMDIEGAEKLALDGMRELSYRNPELNLVVEVNLSFNIEEVFEALHVCRFSRFYLLEDNSREVNIPKDIPYIISTAHGILVNLLCGKTN